LCAALPNPAGVIVLGGVDGEDDIRHYRYGWAGHRLSQLRGRCVNQRMDAAVLLHGCCSGPPEQDVCKIIASPSVEERPQCRRSGCSWYGRGRPPVSPRKGLAHVLRVDRSTVGRWESGETEPQAWLQPKIAKVLGVSRAELRGMLSAADETRARVTPRPATASLDADEAQHLSSALADARRYLDVPVVTYFERRLELCMADDGTNGPTQTLPVVLGIVGVVQQHAREVKPDVRRHLLRLGARSAEFAGWLYRDASRPDLSLYWRDRAAEWALESGDWAMLGYILLKKSQSAWDGRDGLRMLTLAQAAQAGPWQLPTLVQAEAMQQEARGLAMTGERRDVVHRKLDKAQAMFASAGSGDREDGHLSRHYSEHLLMLQSAICYCEAGEPLRAAELYRTCLATDGFSYRDRGYFLSLMASALALAGAPDDACETGWEALAVARRTDSKRTKRELTRVCDLLEPWQQHRPAVRDLAEAVTTSAL
jgi:DNA-binding XRE family transcriptional regulator